MAAGPPDPAVSPTCRVPDLPSPQPAESSHRGCPRLCCLNNLWASGPPLGSRLISRTNICSISAQSLRAFFLLFFAHFLKTDCTPPPPLRTWVSEERILPRPRTLQNEMAPVPPYLALFFQSSRLRDPHQRTSRGKYFQKLPCRWPIRTRSGTSPFSELLVDCVLCGEIYDRTCLRRRAHGYNSGNVNLLFKAFTVLHAIKPSSVGWPGPVPFMEMAADFLSKKWG